jgi:hypothetical protein
MENALMTKLWTFDSQDKLERFAEVLKSNDIPYEIISKGKQSATNLGVTIAVEEDDFAKAKRLLMKHHKRRTSGDYM